MDWAQKLAWLKAKFDVVSHAGYETVKTRDITLVVDRDSALALVNDADPINRTHADLAKPPDTDDLAYVSVRRAFTKAVPQELCSKPAPSTLVEGVLRSKELTKSKILKIDLEQSDFEQPNEDDRVISNYTGLPITLLIYDCAGRFRETSGQANTDWACLTVAPDGAVHGKIFLEFRQPSGWFLFFRRFLDPETGGIKDVFLEAFDVFEPKSKELILVNGDPRSGDAIELIPVENPSN